MLGRWSRLLLLFELFGYAGLTAVLVRLSGWPLLAAVLLSLLLAFLFRAGPILLSYLYAHWYRQSPGKARTSVSAKTFEPPQILREVLVFYALALHTTFDFLLRKDAPGRAKQTAPLLLVHGYLSNRACWWWLKPRLEAAGRSVATLTLEPPYGDIDGYAEQIARRVAWLREQAGAEQVILVGHSMGGLACLAYLRRYGEDDVAKLITLGTPYRGTAAAALVFGRNAAQMQTGSGWLKALDDFFADLPLNIPAVACYSAQDNMILPSSHAMLAGAENRQLPAMGHLSMLMSPAVLTVLLEHG